MYLLEYLEEPLNGKKTHHLQLQKVTGTYEGLVLALHVA